VGERGRGEGCRCGLTGTSSSTVTGSERRHHLGKLSFEWRGEKEGALQPHHLKPGQQKLKFFLPLQRERVGNIHHSCTKNTKEKRMEEGGRKVISHKTKHVSTILCWVKMEDEGRTGLKERNISFTGHGSSNCISN